jgi:hypothetical protein
VDEQSQAAVNPASFASAGRGPLVGWKVPAPRVHVSSGVGGPPANALSHPAAASAQKVKLVQSGLASQRAAQASCLECRFGFFVFLFFRGSGEVEKRKGKKKALLGRELARARLDDALVASISTFSRLPFSFSCTLSFTPGFAEMYREAEPVTPSFVSAQAKPLGKSADTKFARELAMKIRSSAEPRLLEEEPKRPMELSK